MKLKNKVNCAIKLYDDYEPICIKCRNILYPTEEEKCKAIEDGKFGALFCSDQCAICFPLDTLISNQHF